MFEFLGRLTELLQGMLDSPWLWLAVFALSGLDALLPFMPSESTVITVAVLLGPDPWGLALLAALAASGALAGDCLGYWIGRTAGPRALRGLLRGERGRVRHAWARAKVRRHAAVLIIAGRYVPGGRVAVALTTGSLRFPAARFAGLDAIGTGIWAIYAVALGYLGGSRFSDDPAKGLLLSLGTCFAVLGCIELGRRIAARRAHQAEHAPPGPRHSAGDRSRIGRARAPALSYEARNRCGEP